MTFLRVADQLDSKTIEELIFYFQASLKFSKAREVLKNAELSILAKKKALDYVKQNNSDKSSTGSRYKGDTFHSNDLESDEEEPNRASDDELLADVAAGPKVKQSRSRQN
jgi:hypothetical protein